MKKLLIASAIALTLSTHTFAMAETVGQRIDDAKIVTVVNTDLVKDKELSAMKINVDSTQGHVILRGTAPNNAAKERAEVIAKGVNGVTHVDNQLIVSNKATGYDNTKANMSKTANNVNNSVINTANKAGDKLDDVSINTTINSGLMADNDLSAMKINVDVKNGQVWLKGSAPTTAAKNRATDIAKNVDGVTSVHNQLTVRK